MNTGIAHRRWQFRSLHLFQAMLCCAIVLAIIHYIGLEAIIPVWLFLAAALFLAGVIRRSIKLMGLAVLMLLGPNVWLALALIWHAHQRGLRPVANTQRVG
jgi:hypothetical protein